MKWLTPTLVVVLPLLATPVAAGQSVCWVTDIKHPDRSAADSTRFAAAWVPPLERLSAAIPSLSPKEKQWLEEEMRGGGQRSVHAVSSREYAIQRAKERADTELTLARRLTENRARAVQVRDLLWLAHSLVDSDAALYLAWLEAKGVIPREVVPWEWKFMAEGKGGATLEETIRWGPHDWHSMSLGALSRPS